MKRWEVDSCRFSILLGFYEKKLLVSSQQGKSIVITLAYTKKARASKTHVFLQSSSNPVIDLSLLFHELPG